MKPPAYPISAFVRPILGLALCLLVLEIGLRQGVLKRVLPWPSPFYNEEVVRRTELLGRFGGPDVVFIGSSITRSNVNSGLVSSLTGRRCFGLGLSALSPGANLLMWKNHWSKLVDSRALVVHIMRPSDFDDFYEPRSDSNLLKGRHERGWIDPGNRSILDQEWFPRLKLSDYYGSVSKALTSNRRPIMATPFKTDEFGFGAYAEVLSSSREKALMSSNAPIQSFEKSLASGNIEDIVADFKSILGNRYVIAICPEYVLKWRAPEDSVVFEQQLRDFGVKAGVRVVVPETGAMFRDRSHFSDFTHYAEKGADVYSRALAKELK
jgi:hypothetical protein